jgi:hypothetical protein
MVKEGWLCKSAARLYTFHSVISSTTKITVWTTLNRVYLAQNMQLIRENTWILYSVYWSYKHKFCFRKPKWKVTTKDTVWEGVTVPHIHQTTIWTVYLALLVSWTVTYVRSNMPADALCKYLFPQHMPTQQWYNIVKDLKFILYLRVSSFNYSVITVWVIYLFIYLFTRMS